MGERGAAQGGAEEEAAGAVEGRRGAPGAPVGGVLGFAVLGTGRGERTDGGEAAEGTAAHLGAAELAEVGVDGQRFVRPGAVRGQARPAPAQLGEHVELFGVEGWQELGGVRETGFLVSAPAGRVHPAQCGDRDG
ncbi:putative amino acid permease-associated region [Streptomyces sp. Tu6071]|nr:putative amino acid permease-associated region [Streptomyces sp. Tu6071]